MLHSTNIVINKPRALRYQCAFFRRPREPPPWYVPQERLHLTVSRASRTTVAPARRSIERRPRFAPRSRRQVTTRTWRAVSRAGPAPRDGAVRAPSANLSHPDRYWSTRTGRTAQSHHIRGRGAPLCSSRSDTPRKAWRTQATSGEQIAGSNCVYKPV